MGWNCIQRRNFAILEAYERGADTIALIDDDNIPYKSWFTNILVNKSVKAKFLTINKNAFDPIGFTNYKFLWHRGFPLGMVKNRKYTFKGVKKITPIPTKNVQKQIIMVLDDIGTNAVKIGMLYNANIIKCVSKKVYQLLLL